MMSAPLVVAASPAACVIAPAVAATSIVPGAAATVTLAVPENVMLRRARSEMLPEVLATGAPASRSEAAVTPPTTSRRMLPEPCAVTAPLSVRVPSSRRREIGPLPPAVWRPGPTTVSALVCSRKMPPLVVLVAVSEPSVVLRFAAPAPPMPVAAARVARPVLTRLAASAAVLSVRAPVVAVTVSAPPVLVRSDRATLVAAW